MSAQRLRVADVLRAHWSAYNQTHAIPPHVAEAIRHMQSCRTAELGGHLYVCDACGHEVPMYNSCGDRNCPSCQTAAKEKWLTKRRQELLPVQYFHCVFTLPHDLNGLVDANRELLLGELFTTVNWVLQRFAHDPQWHLEGELGVIAMLHTWTQRLQEHFHVHCIVPGGAWREETGDWIPCREGYLFRKESLCSAFRNRYVKRLELLRNRKKLRFEAGAEGLADQQQWNQLVGELESCQWVVYPKATADCSHALEYLSRYTHRVAISDHRLVGFEDGVVRYSWRDRRNDNEEKIDELPAEEFIMRFLYHVLPKGFQKIRYYGFLANAKRGYCLKAIRAALNTPAPPLPRAETLAEAIFERTGVDITCCPRCSGGHLVNVGIILKPLGRAPP